ncbi:MAG: sugar transferase [bacterium]
MAVRIFPWLVPCYLLFFFICDLFDVRVCRRPKVLAQRIISAFMIPMVLVVIYSLVSLDTTLLRQFLPPWGMALLFVLLWRLAAGELLPSISFPRRVLIIGNTFNGRKLAQALREHTPGKYHFLGIVESEDKLSSLEMESDTDVLGKVGDLPQIVDRYRPQVMVIALDERREAFSSERFLDYKLQGLEVYDAPDFYERVTGKILINRLRPSWLLFTCGFHSQGMIRIVKRLLDIILSSLLLILTSPVILLSALLIRLDSEGPILFRQERVGEREKIFKLYKFRTMRADAEQQTGPIWTKKNDHRITRIGRFLRQTRIDELPQLVNVFKGEMSLVGPRPERPFFVQKLDRVIPYYKQRLIVKPGITGWAAVNYRYCGTLRETGEKLGYDLFYIKHMSLALDFFIALKTINIILFRKGAL